MIDPSLKLPRYWSVEFGKTDIDEINKAVGWNQCLKWIEANNPGVEIKDHTLAEMEAGVHDHQ